MFNIELELGYADGVTIFSNVIDKHKFKLEINQYKY